MRIFIFLLIVISAIGASSIGAEFIVPKPPTINASGYVLLEPYTNTIIVEKNSREHLPPASLTKIMTSYVAAAELAAGRIKLDDEVPVSVNAWRTGGSRTYLLEGTTATMEDLLRGIVVQSGNDASVAVAEYIAGSEDAFADLMNEYAQLIGLEDTHFVNSTGLPDDSLYTTAYDIALLSARLISDFPEHYRLYAEKEFTYADITQPNRNRMLILDKSVDGIKTGYTEAAGYCLAASALRDGMRLISVVMGTESTSARVRETRKLFTFGFRNYETHTVVDPSKPLKTVDAWFGVEDTLDMGVEESVTLTILRGQLENLSIDAFHPPRIDAPIKLGQKIGEVAVSFEGTELARVPLVARHAVEEDWFLNRLWDSVNLMLKSDD